MICDTAAGWISEPQERVEFEAGWILVAQKQENTFQGHKVESHHYSHELRVCCCGCGSQRGCSTESASLLRRGNPFTRFYGRRNEIMRELRTGEN
jgi:hypothetical protein